MKVFSFSALMILFAAVWVAVFGYAEFFILLLLSILPINLMYGFRQLAEIHQDESTYKSWRLLTYPSLIFGMLMFTHSFWLGQFIKLPT